MGMGVCPVSGDTWFPWVGWGGGLVSKDARLGALSPAPVQVTIFPSLGLRVWVWLDMDMPRVQMWSCLSGDIEASGSEQVADRRSVPGWSRWWGMGWAGRSEGRLLIQWARALGGAAGESGSFPVSPGAWTGRPGLAQAFWETPLDKGPCAQAVGECARTLPKGPPSAGDGRGGRPRAGLLQL